MENDQVHPDCRGDESHVQIPAHKQWKLTLALNHDHLALTLNTNLTPM